MPRFFFDLRLGSSFIRDDDGEELADLMAAKRCATEAAVEILHETVSPPGEGEVAVDIREDSGLRVATVTVTIRVDSHSVEKRSV